MFIKYKDKIYNLIKEKDYIISTRQESKAESGFLRTKKSFYKQIEKSSPYIQDIYNVDFLLNYDSHLEKVDKEWVIQPEKEYLKEGQVLLRFTKGLLPEWKVEEQAVCSKYVDINECYNFKAVYTYTVKDGKILDSPKKVEKGLSKSEFKEMLIGYSNNNI